MASNEIPAVRPTLKTLLSNGVLWKIVSLVVSVGLMAYILSKIELSTFFQMVRDVPAWSLAGAAGLYLLLNVFRALRFRALIGEPKPSLISMMPIIFYHNFLNRVLPFNTGEISYVVLINQRLKQPMSDGISSLITARLFDLGMVILGAAFGLLSVSAEPFGQRPLVFAALIAVLAVYTVALYYSGSLVRLAVRVWLRLFAPWLIRRFPRLENLVESRLHLLADRFDRIHQPRLLLTTCLLSLCTYGASAAFDMTLMHGLGIVQPFGTLLTIISIKMFIEAIPIVVTGFGVIEGSWAFGLITLAGMDVNTAAAIGLFLHACQVIVAGITGMIGYFILTRGQAKRPASPETRTTEI